MDEVEKLQQELYDKKWLLTKAQVVRIARFVMRREIEARLDEINLNMTCDSERLNNIRLAELRKQLEK